MTFVRGSAAEARPLCGCSRAGAAAGRAEPRRAGLGQAGAGASRAGHGEADYSLCNIRSVLKSVKISI